MASRSDPVIANIHSEDRLLIEASYQLTSLNHVVEQLVMNALDAAAGSVAVRVETGQQRRVTVVDNGSGMDRPDLELFGHRSSSKYSSEPGAIGRTVHRGMTIACLRCVARKIAVITRSGEASWVKRIKAEKETLEPSQRLCPGTTIIVDGLFHAMPVRLKTLTSNVELEWELMILWLTSLAILRNDVSFSLRNEDTGRLVVQTHKTASSLATFGCLFDTVDTARMHNIVKQQSGFALKMWISSQGTDESHLQFVFVNNRPVLQSKIQDLLTKSIAGTVIVKPVSGMVTGKLPPLHPVYLLMVEVDPDEVNISGSGLGGTTDVWIARWPVLKDLLGQTLMEWAQANQLCIRDSKSTAAIGGTTENLAADAGVPKLANQPTLEHSEVIVSEVVHRKNNTINETASAGFVESGPVHGLDEGAADIGTLPSSLIGGKDLNCQSSNQKCLSGRASHLDESLPSDTFALSTGFHSDYSQSNKSWKRSSQVAVLEQQQLQLPFSITESEQILDAYGLDSKEDSVRSSGGCNDADLAVQQEINGQQSDSRPSRSHSKCAITGPICSKSDSPTKLRNRCFSTTENVQSSSQSVPPLAAQSVRICQSLPAFPYRCDLIGLGSDQLENNVEHVTCESLGKHDLNYISESCGPLGHEQFPSLEQSYCATLPESTAFRHVEKNQVSLTGSREPVEENRKTQLHQIVDSPERQLLCFPPSPECQIDCAGLNLDSKLGQLAPCLGHSDITDSCGSAGDDVETMDDVGNCHLKHGKHECGITIVSEPVGQVDVVRYNESSISVDANCQKTLVEDIGCPGFDLNGAKHDVINCFGTHLRDSESILVPIQNTNDMCWFSNQQESCGNLNFDEDMVAETFCNDNILSGNCSSDLGRMSNNCLATEKMRSDMMGRNPIGGSRCGTFPKNNNDRTTSDFHSFFRTNSNVEDLRSNLPTLGNPDESHRFSDYQSSRLSPFGNPNERRKFLWDPCDFQQTEAGSSDRSCLELDGQSPKKKTRIALSKESKQSSFIATDDVHNTSKNLFESDCWNKEIVDLVDFQSLKPDLKAVKSSMITASSWCSHKLERNHQDSGPFALNLPDNVRRNERNLGNDVSPERCNSFGKEPVEVNDFAKNFQTSHKSPSPNSQRVLVQEHNFNIFGMKPCETGRLMDFNNNSCWEAAADSNSSNVRFRPSSGTQVEKDTFIYSQSCVDRSHNRFNFPKSANSCNLEKSFSNYDYRIGGNNDNPHLDCDSNSNDMTAGAFSLSMNLSGFDHNAVVGANDTSLVTACEYGRCNSTGDDRCFDPTVVGSRSARVIPSPNWTHFRLSTNFISSQESVKGGFLSQERDDLSQTDEISGYNSFAEFFSSIHIDSQRSQGLRPDSNGGLAFGIFRDPNRIPKWKAPILKNVDFGPSGRILTGSSLTDEGILIMKSQYFEPGPSEYCEFQSRPFPDLLEIGCQLNAKTSSSPRLHTANSQLLLNSCINAGHPTATATDAGDVAIATSNTLATASRLDLDSPNDTVDWSQLIMAEGSETEITKAVCVGLPKDARDHYEAPENGMHHLTDPGSVGSTHDDVVAASETSADKRELCHHQDTMIPCGKPIPPRPPVKRNMFYIPGSNGGCCNVRNYRRLETWGGRGVRRFPLPSASRNVASSSKRPMRSSRLESIAGKSERECVHGARMAGVMQEWTNPQFAVSEEAIGNKTALFGTASGQSKAGIDLKLSLSSLKQAEVIGLLDCKFIVVLVPLIERNQEKAVVLLDQHAVDERIRLEQMLPSRDPVGKVEVGVDVFEPMLLKPPLSIAVTADVVRLFSMLRLPLERLGFKIQLPPTAETRELTVTAVPRCIFERRKGDRRLLTEDCKRVTREILMTTKQSHGAVMFLPSLIQETLAYKACRSAIKFGDWISRAKAECLVRALTKCDNPFSCAHGRPSLVPLFRYTE